MKETIETFNVNASFGLLVGRTTKCLAERLQRRFAENGVGISMSHWIILAQLWHEDGLSQQEISVRSGVAKPNVTTFVDALEKESYIVRVPDQIDRRVNRIFLTQKGKDLRPLAVAQAIAVYETAFNGVSEEARNTAMGVLQSVVANLQKHDGSGACSCE